MSKNLGVDLKDCIIVLVEKIECKDKQELHKRERYYIEKYKNEGLNIVNKYIPGRTKKEYRDKNKEKLKEKDKKYYEKNKEKIKEKDKQYYEDNKEKIKKQKKENYEKNKEHYKKKNKDYREENKEKGKEKIKCVCGAIIQKYNNKHIKSKKHISYIENEN
tara:strand:+ start:140 stop:622 length:483 start_codon:yes stop_codon:yes gene_type:complete